MRRRTVDRALALAALIVVALAGCSAVSGLSGYTFDGTTSAGGAGGTDANGGGGASECDKAADCSPRDCIDVACKAGRCVVAPADIGALCAEGVCDGHGSCVGCVSASNCPKADDCQVAACVSRSCAVGPAAPKSTCHSDGGAICDGSGHCVPCIDPSDCGQDRTCAGGVCHDLCSDGAKDYDETDADCGGPDCQACGVGHGCKVGTDCSSGFCVDGVCCSSACSDPCVSCNVTGSVGTCLAIPMNGVDANVCDATHGSCGGGCACDGQAHCLKQLGGACQTDSECASHACNSVHVCVP